MSLSRCEERAHWQWALTHASFLVCALGSQKGRVGRVSHALYFLNSVDWRGAPPFVAIRAHLHGGPLRDFSNVTIRLARTWSRRTGQVHPPSHLGRKAEDTIVGSHLGGEIEKFAGLLGSRICARMWEERDWQEMMARGLKGWHGRP